MLRLLSRLLVITALGVAAWVSYGLFVPAGPSGEKLVQLKPGSSARHIAADLERAGIIRSQYAFALEGRRILL
jgi:UPF0755 protein